jgi:hypothetical protein
VTGSGTGVVVTSVTAGAAADGVLQAGDVIVGTDEGSITQTGDLFDLLGRHAPGDVLTFVVDRVGGQMRLPITLGAAPEDPKKVRIGAGVVTRFLDTPPDALIDGTVQGPYTRLVEVDGRLFRLDPIAGEFASTRLPAPPTAWHAAGSHVFLGTASGGVIQAIDGTTFTLPQGVATGVIGSVAGDLVVVATSLDGSGATLLRISPDSLLVDWSARLATIDTAPVAAFPAPGTQKLLLARPSGSDSYRYEVWDAALGLRVDTPKLESMTFDAVFGWYDQTHILGQLSGAVSAYDPITGEQTKLQLPTTVRSGDELYPVGDGTHIVQVSGRDMTLVTLDEGGESRQLIVNCAIGTVDVAGSNV